MIRGIAKLLKKEDKNPFFYTTRIVAKRENGWTRIKSITFTFPNEPELYLNDTAQFTIKIDGGSEIHDS